MKIQDSLVTRIENFMKELYNSKEIKNIDKTKYKIKKSKTTNSIYIIVWTYCGSDKYTTKYRISDHYNSKIRTKVLVERTSFDLIKNRIKKLIIDLIRARELGIVYNFGK